VKPLHAVQSGAACLVCLTLFFSGCAQRLHVATGTTIGLVANSGDGSSRPPHVTLAYKRAEMAFVPTGQKAATKGAKGGNTDAYSALAVFDFQTKWFGKTTIQQFIGTGHAARDVIGVGNEFSQKFAAATFSQPSKEIQERLRSLEDKIIAKFGGLTPEQKAALAAELLTKAGYPNPKKPAEEVLQDTLSHVHDEATMRNFESAFTRLK